MHVRLTSSKYGLRPKGRGRSGRPAYRANLSDNQNSMQRPLQTSIYNIASAPSRRRVTKLSKASSTLVGTDGRSLHLSDETLPFRKLRAIQREAPILQRNCLRLFSCTGLLDNDGRRPDPNHRIGLVYLPNCKKKEPTHLNAE